MGSTSVRETMKTAKVIQTRGENNMNMLFFTSENTVPFHFVKIAILLISDI